MKIAQLTLSSVFSIEIQTIFYYYFKTNTISLHYINMI